MTIEVVIALRMYCQNNHWYVGNLEAYLEIETTTTLVPVVVEVDVTVAIGADVMIGVVTDVDVTVVRRIDWQYVNAAAEELCTSAAMRL